MNWISRRTESIRETGASSLNGISRGLARMTQRSASNRRARAVGNGLPRRAVAGPTAGEPGLASAMARVRGDSRVIPPRTASQSDIAGCPSRSSSGAPRSRSASCCRICSASGWVAWGRAGTGSDAASVATERSAERWLWISGSKILSHGNHSKIALSSPRRS